MKTKHLTVLALLITTILSAVNAQSENPFTSTSINRVQPANAAITSFHLQEQNGKLLFDWSVATNEEANLFELEKSKDGKSFATAALIFGTDKKDTDHYQYYEKAAGQKIYYRVKMVGKDNQAHYSAILSFPAA